MAVCYHRNSLAYSSQQLAYIVATMEQMVTGKAVKGCSQVSEGPHPRPAPLPLVRGNLMLSPAGSGHAAAPAGVT